MSLSNTISLTAEQRAILDTCPPPFHLNDDGNDCSEKGHLTRITAAAGAGKTTTLLHLALRGFHLGHQRITYLTFTNAAAEDGSRRLKERLWQEGTTASCRIDARTLHSCAKKELNAHLAALYKNEDYSNQPQLSDKHVKEWITRSCQNDIEDFLYPCFRKLSACPSRSATTAANRQQRARDQVEFFIFKSLVHFCQSSWSFQEYTSGEKYNPVTGTRERIFNRDYYPAKKFHAGSGQGEELGFATADYCNRIDFYAKQVCRLWDIALRDDIRCFDIEMKRVQLEKIRIPGTLLLVDESQDMDAAQIDWVTLQVRYGTHVYVVGDPAQAIYGFRGARPSFLMSLDVSRDCKLTDSWRFGANIANIANLILYAKEKSPQTAVHPVTGKHKNWIPYRTRPGKPKNGRVTEESLVENWKERKVTVLARANAQLLLVALGALGIAFADNGEDDYEASSYDEQIPPDSATSSTQPPGMPVELPRIHINGKGESSGLKLWRKTLKQIRTVYRIFASNTEEVSLPHDQFPEFNGRTVTWKEFVSECDSRELTRYNNAINVVEKLKHRTLAAMESFKTHVMEAKYTEKEAHIVLSTCHSAKGMEWDNVQVCDDFIDLHQFKSENRGNDRYQRLPYSNRGCAAKEVQLKWQFDYDNWGDDVNLVYVACTRAKKLLSLPPCVCEVLKVFDSVHSVVRKPNNKKTDFVLLPGCKDPLDVEKLRPFHEQLVAPLRQEFGLTDKASMYAELVQSNDNQGAAPAESVIVDFDDDDETEMPKMIRDEKPPAKKAKIDNAIRAESVVSNPSFAPVVVLVGSDASDAIEILD